MWSIVVVPTPVMRDVDCVWKSSDSSRLKYRTPHSKASPPGMPSSGFIAPQTRLASALRARVLAWIPIDPTATPGASGKRMW